MGRPVLATYVFATEPHLLEKCVCLLLQSNSPLLWQLLWLCGHGFLHYWRAYSYLTVLFKDKFTQRTRFWFDKHCYGSFLHHRRCHSFSAAASSCHPNFITGFSITTGILVGLAEGLKLMAPSRRNLRYRSYIKSTSLSCSYWSVQL